MSVSPGDSTPTPCGKKIFLLPDQLRYHIHLWTSFTQLSRKCVLYLLGVRHPPYHVLRQCTNLHAKKNTCPALCILGGCFSSRFFVLPFFRTYLFSSTPCQLFIYLIICDEWLLSSYLLFMANAFSPFLVPSHAALSVLYQPHTCTTPPSFLHSGQFDEFECRK